MLQLVARLEETIDEGEIAILICDFGVEAAGMAVDLLSWAGESGRSVELRKMIDSRGSELASLEPLLDGNEIAELIGIEPGPLLGKLKRELIEEQIRGEVRVRDEAMSFLRRRRSED